MSALTVGQYLRRRAHAALVVPRVRRPRPEVRLIERLWRLVDKAFETGAGEWPGTRQIQRAVASGLILHAGSTGVMLDLHGQVRGLGRIWSENDATYRGRLLVARSRFALFGTKAGIETFLADHGVTATVSDNTWPVIPLAVAVIPGTVNWPQLLEIVRRCRPAWAVTMYLPAEGSAYTLLRFDGSWTIGFDPENPEDTRYFGQLVEGS
jgi:hypothetical protein